MTKYHAPTGGRRRETIEVRIARLKAKHEKLGERIGHLMTQRADVEEMLAAEYELLNRVNAPATDEESKS